MMYFGTNILNVTGDYWNWRNVSYVKLRHTNGNRCIGRYCVNLSISSSHVDCDDNKSGPFGSFVYSSIQLAVIARSSVTVALCPL